MKRVTGIGGIFFKCDDPESTKDWYKEHLGINSGPYGGTFEWRHAADKEKKGSTAWNPFPSGSDYFNPSEKEFMINYRVDDLDALLEALKKEGVEVIGEPEVFEYGKFGWIMDPNGIKIELWEPADEAFDEISENDQSNESS